MGEHDDLLRRHQPGLKYDSMEQYFCDSAAEWTDNPGNELRRADGAHAPRRAAGQRPDADPGLPRRRRTTPTARRCATTTASATPEELPRAVRRAARRAPRAAQPHVRPRRRGQRAPVAAVLVLLLLQRLQPGARDRPARGRLGDDPAAHPRRRARPRRLRPAPPGREAPVGAGRSRSPATPTGRWSTSPAARTPPTSSPASTRPRRGTTSPTASATRRARRSRSSPTTSRRGSRGRACGATRARGSAASTSRARRARRPTPPWTNPDGALATAWEPQRKDAIAAPAVVISRDRGRMRVDFDFTRQPAAARRRRPCRSRSTRATRRACRRAPTPSSSRRPAAARWPPTCRSTRPSTTTSTRARRAATRRSRRSRCSPSSTRRARSRSCRSSSASCRASAASWPASAASSATLIGARLRGLGQPRQPRREARARRRSTALPEPEAVAAGGQEQVREVAALVARALRDLVV